MMSSWFTLWTIQWWDLSPVLINESTTLRLSSSIGYKHYNGAIDYLFSSWSPRLHDVPLVYSEVEVTMVVIHLPCPNSTTLSSSRLFPWRRSLFCSSIHFGSLLHILHITVTCHCWTHGWWIWWFCSGFGDSCGSSWRLMNPLNHWPMIELQRMPLLMSKLSISQC